MELTADLNPVYETLRAFRDMLDLLTSGYDLTPLMEDEDRTEIVRRINDMAERLNAISGVSVPEVPSTDTELAPVLKSIGEELTRLKQALEEVRAPWVHEPEEPGVLKELERFHANLTVNNADGTYDFEEVRLDTGTWTACTNGRTGTAEELNLNSDIDTGTVVEIADTIGSDGVAAYVFPFNEAEGITLVTFDGCCKIDEANADTAYADTKLMNNDEAAGNEERLLLHLTSAMIGNKNWYFFLRHALEMTFGGNSTGPKWKIELNPIVEDFDWEGVGAGAPTWNDQPTLDDSDTYEFSGPVYPYSIGTVGVGHHAFVNGEEFDMEILDHCICPTWFVVEGDTWAGKTLYGIEIRVVDFTGHNGGTWDLKTQLTYDLPGFNMIVPLA